MPQKQTTVDDLAGMVRDGFDDVGKRLDGINESLDTLEGGQEEIKLKLDNVAYRFELKELQNRVELLEKKAGIK